MDFRIPQRGTSMRQPDIEIYLKDADVDHKAIAAWLGAALGPCSDWVQKGQTYKCKAGNVPVTWLPKAVGKWNSLYLESDQTPWDDDIACARGRRVRRNGVRPHPGHSGTRRSPDGGDHRS
jgi:hypothetical protein